MTDKSWNDVDVTALKLDPPIRCRWGRKLRQTWADGALSGLPLVEGMLLMILVASAHLFLNVPEETVINTLHAATPR
ncbi:MAG: hypothetical protein AAFW87_13580 [Pseudomonadota bacterium]